MMETVDKKYTLYYRLMGFLKQIDAIDIDVRTHVITGEEALMGKVPKPHWIKYHQDNPDGEQFGELVALKAGYVKKNSESKFKLFRLATKILGYI